MGVLTRALTSLPIVRAMRTGQSNAPTMTALASMQRMRRAGKSDAATYRNWSWHSPLVRTAIDIRKGQVETAEYDLGRFSRDLPEPDPGLMRRMREVIDNPNPGDVSFGTAISAIMEDMLVLDAGCVEKERTLRGELLWLWPTDGAPIKIDRLWNGDPKMPRYFWEPQPGTSVPLLNDDLIYMKMHQRTDSPLGMSYLEILRDTIDNEINASLVNARRVSGSAPDGIMDMGENARDTQVAQFRSYFESELAGGQSVLGFWGGTKGAKFIPFGNKNVEMQYMEWLTYQARKIALVFQMSPQDLGITFDVNRANAQVQQENSEDRGERAILKKVQDFVTAEVCWDPYWGGRSNNIAFRFRAVSNRQSKTVAETKKMTLANMPSESINEARKDMGKEPIGDPNDESNPYNKLMANTPLGLVSLDRVVSAYDVAKVQMAKSPGTGESEGSKPEESTDA